MVRLRGRCCGRGLDGRRFRRGKRCANTGGRALRAADGATTVRVGAGCGGGAAAWVDVGSVVREHVGGGKKLDGSRDFACANGALGEGVLGGQASLRNGCTFSIFRFRATLCGEGAGE